MQKSRRKLKKTPAFKSEAEEREFWARVDSTEYVDWRRATQTRFPNLRPSSTAIVGGTPWPLRPHTAYLAVGTRTTKIGGAVIEWTGSAAKIHRAMRSAG